MALMCSPARMMTLDTAGSDTKVPKAAEISRPRTAVAESVDRQQQTEFRDSVTSWWGQLDRDGQEERDGR